MNSDTLPVCYDAAALVAPQGQESVCGGDHVRCCPYHALPDAGQVSQVEHVMELGWGGQQLVLE